MYEQLNTQQFVAWSKQWSNATLKANQIAVAGMERAVDMQLKAFEQHAKLTSSFFADLSEVRDAEAMQSLMPKSAEMIKQSTDHAVSVGQALIDNMLKTNEQIGEVVRGEVEHVQNHVAKAAPVSKKTNAR